MPNKYRIDIDYDENGVYLIKQGTPTKGHTVREDVLKQLNVHKIKDINMDTVENIINSDDINIREKISSNIEPFVKDEEISLEVSHDSMEAYIKFTPPVFGGKLLSERDITKYLDDKGVVFGVDYKTLKSLVNERQYIGKVKIAQGIKALNGKDGYIKYFFDINKKVLRPIIMENGKVDYRNLNMIDSAEEGQLLCRIIDATKGTDGRDIYGRDIRGESGKKPPKLTGGQTVTLSSDGKELTAKIQGQILFMDKKVSISKVLEIHENVGPATGNINFGGSIKIFGNVQSDYEIIAGGNIEIIGMVEGDKVIAGGNISVTGGIQGRSKTIINATGNLTAKFISNASIYAGGDIFSDSIVRCTTKCRGSVELAGTKGTLTGGAAYIKKEMTANTIGSSLATNTAVHVGLDPLLFTQYLTMKDQLEEMEIKLQNYLKDISTYEKETFMELSDEKKSAYYGLVHSTKYLRKNIISLKIKISKIISLLDIRKNMGEINVRNVLHQGVKVQVGNAVVFVKEEIYACKIINKDSKMKVILKS